MNRFFTLLFAASCLTAVGSLKTMFLLMVRNNVVINGMHKTRAVMDTM